MRRLRKTALVGFFLSLVLFVPSALGQPPKYIFLMIGDGMGVAQRYAAQTYKRIQTDSKPGQAEGKMQMDRFPTRGLTTTNSSNRPVTDSAAAATALACGKKTYNGAIAYGPDHKTKLRSFAYDAKDAGMKVGIVTSVTIDHATPAAFYACETSRGHYYEIACQLSDSGFNYFAGSGMSGKPNKKKKKIHPVDKAKKAGYTYYKGKAGLENIKAGDDKILWLAGLGYDIDRKPGTVSLADMTRKGIELMQDNDKGFFMMVEGGRIDWAGHANDLATNVKETLAFDEAIQVVYDFYKKHPDETLIVVTGDHECGGMRTDFQGGFSPQRFQKTIDAQTFSQGGLNHRIEKWKKENKTEEEVLEEIRKLYDLSDLTKAEDKKLRDAVTYTFHPKTMPDSVKSHFGKRKNNLLAITCQAILAKRCGVTWTSFGHTAAAVSTTAVGSGAEKFAGRTDNTDIAKNIRSLVTQTKDK